eukprot:145889_1
MYYSISTIISSLFLALLCISFTNGQCNADCSDCDGDPTSCTSDSNCYYLGPNIPGDLCRLKDDCASDCTLCTEAECNADEGPNGDCLWISGPCFGTTCATNCEQCSAIDECNESLAAPYGCYHGGGNVENCLPINATSPPITTEEPMTTEELCPDWCPTISLISIGNITIAPCVAESDCDCEEGLTSFTVKYLNDATSADTITFYYDTAQTQIACPSAEDVDYLDDVICTLDVSGADRFGITTSFVIEYADGSSDCEGSFDTSCTDDILGDFGDGCSDLVVTSWTDVEDGVCYGNVSLIEPTTTESSGSSSSSSSGSSSNSQTVKRWRWRQASKDSSESRRRRRRRLSSGSSSSSGSGSGYTSTTTWYENKKCVPNCADWGAQRGLDCGCYESCTAGALNTSCYEGTTAGYCGTGVCCCGGECISTECDYGSGSSSGSDSDSDSNRRLLGSERCSASSDSSDSTEGFYSYSEWYSDRCGITETETETIFSSSGSGSGSSSSSSGGRRRRQLSGASFGSARRLQSSSSSASASSSGYNEEYTIITSNDYINEFIIETCVLYEVDLNGTIPDCVLDIVIFLPLCENNYTDFNSSNLNASDITGLITDETFEAGTNVASAEGAIIDGQLGILIELESLDVATFEICVGNVTVNGDNIDTLNITTIDVSTGTAYVNTTDGVNECPINGLPCFNFFFDAECPDNVTEIYRSCECVDGMVSIDVLYTGTDNVTVLFTRLTGQRGLHYGEFDVVQGDIVTAAPTTTAKPTLGWKTGVALLDASGDVICEGGIRKCREDVIGEEVDGCEDLVVLSWTAADGALCDEIAITGSSSGSSSSDSTSSENLLWLEREMLETPLKVLQQLDPYVRYSLIGVLVAFCGLMLAACYICLIRSKAVEDKEDDVGRKMSDQVALHTAERPRADTNFSEYGVTPATNISVEMSNEV